MTYIHNFDEPPPLEGDAVRRLLGGKGHNLAVMRSELGLPVPPGFTITTEAGRAYMADGWPDGLDDEISEQMARIEDEVGRRFGGPGEPLLVSVRSGAAVSMPGMMDTVLNLGLTSAGVDDLAAACGDAEFAAESHRRLQTMYREIVGSPEVPEDPLEQLRRAIEAVFNSWNSDRARSYRDREGIPDDLGTAVTVQTMVFGNLDDDSGTGVLFTRNPATGEQALFGDILFRAQGEDVVAGTHETDPIGVLEERLPDVYTELEGYARSLEQHFADVCDIEFTIERRKLWLLQVRVGKRSPQAALRFAVEMANDDHFPLTKREAVERVANHLVAPPVTVEPIDESALRLAVGLPASPGIATGSIATSADGAVAMADSGEDVILVRPETSPNDIHGMAQAKGILTSSGGLASHAAVVARGWGLPAVVGATDVVVSEQTVRFGDKSLAAGEVITINGHTGEILEGSVEADAVTPDEVEILRLWAAEAGIDLETTPAKSSAVPTGAGDQSVDAETIIRTLHIKGFATPETLAEVLFAKEDEVDQILASMEADGQLKKMGPMFQLDESLRREAERLMSADRDAWSLGAASTALEGFLPLDEQLKEIVTAWQMREVDGEQILNDHTDEAYDAGVLGDLAELHEEAIAWISPLSDGLARLFSYQRRLERAAREVANGNTDFIASPRIDSYHNVWFELHEDLIQLAGRTREDETAAGRA